MNRSPTTNDSPDSATLPRVVGVWSLGLNAVNLTVAAGIFGLPAIVAGMLGAQAILAYFVCAALIGLVGLCFAEAGSRIGRAGGLYAYATVPFGPIVGGVAGTLMWTSAGSVGDAAIANLLVDTLGAVSPVFQASWLRVAIVLGLFATVAIINIRGVRYGVRLSMALTIIKIAPLALLVVGGLFVLDPSKLAWTSLPPLKNLGETSIVLFYAFVGMEAALSMSGEIIRPSRTVPRGIALGLLIITTLYMGSQLVAQGTLGAALPHSKAPLVDTASFVFGAWGGRMMLLALIISATGCVAGDVLSNPRVLHAFAQQGQMPRQLAAIHPRFGTPAAAIGTYAVVCAVLALSGSFKQLLIIASAGTLMLYMICSLGVLRMRVQKVSIDGAHFQIPFGPVIPLTTCLIILWMLSSLSSRELWTALAFVTVVGVIYAVHEFRRGDR